MPLDLNGDTHPACDREVERRRPLVAQPLLAHCRESTEDRVGQCAALYSSCKLSASQARWVKGEQTALF